MKTIALILGVGAAISFSSCKKEYVCTCRDSDGDIAEVTEYDDTRLVDAKDACEDTEDRLNDNIFSSDTYICTLD